MDATLQRHLQLLTNYSMLVGFHMYFCYAEPLKDEMWTAILPQGWTSPYGVIQQLLLSE